MLLVFAIDGIECDLHRRGAAFEGVAPARMVHEDASHDLRGDREELRPIVPVHVALRIESQPRFVRERSRLKRMAVALVPERQLCLPPQLVVHEGRNGVACLRVARTPRAQEIGDVLRGIIEHHRSGRGRWHEWPRITTHEHLDKG